MAKNTKRRNKRYSHKRNSKKRRVSKKRRRVSRRVSKKTYKHKNMRGGNTISGYYSGYFTQGDDIMNETMTIYKAENMCKSLSNCIGFCYKVQLSTDRDDYFGDYTSPYLIYFKSNNSKFIEENGDSVPYSGWISFVKMEDTRLDKPENMEFIQSVEQLISPDDKVTRFLMNNDLPELVEHFVDLGYDDLELLNEYRTDVEEKMKSLGLENSYPRLRTALDATYPPVAAGVPPATARVLPVATAGVPPATDQSLTIQIYTYVTTRRKNGDYRGFIPAGSIITIYRGTSRSHGSNEIIIPSFVTKGGNIFYNQKFYKVKYGDKYYWVSERDLKPNCLRYGYYL